jgi:hypothetical protein
MKSKTKNAVPNNFYFKFKYGISNVIGPLIVFFYPIMKLLKTKNHRTTDNRKKTFEKQILFR